MSFASNTRAAGGPLPAARPTAIRTDVLALERGLAYRCASALGGALTPRTLDPEQLVARALARAGVSRALAGPAPLPALSALCAALAREARLNGFGRWAARAVIEWHLTARFQCVAHASVPGRTATALPAPLVITGLPRTGSTFLHRWLAATTGTRSLPLWEMAAPIVPERGDRRRRQARRIAGWLRAGATSAELAHFRGVHDADVDDPEECLFLLARGFDCAQFFLLLGRVPTYLAWVEAHQDARARYAGYRRDLSLLLAARGGERLVLKAPAHLRHLDALFEALPEARVVWLHRDPLEVVPSACSLVAMYHRQLSDGLDPAGIGHDVVDGLARDVEAGMRHAEAYPERILHLGYDELVARPFATVERLFRFWEQPLGAPQGGELEAWHRSHPKDRHGVHRYALADFALEASSLHRRFARYRAWAPAAVRASGGRCV